MFSEEVNGPVHKKVGLDGFHTRLVIYFEGGIKRLYKGYLLYYKPNPFFHHNLA